MVTGAAFGEFGPSDQVAWRGQCRVGRPMRRRAVWSSSARARNLFRRGAAVRGEPKFSARACHYPLPMMDDERRRQMEVKDAKIGRDSPRYRWRAVH